LFLADNGSTDGCIDADYAVEVMPDLCGTHFKSFTLRSMIRVDLRNRTIPWSHLMIASGFRSDPFVTSPSQQSLWHAVPGRRPKRRGRQGRREARAQHAEVWV
jgi:hypothetical protein